MPVMPGSPVCSCYETITVYRMTWVFGVRVGGDTPGVLRSFGGKSERGGA
nr:MAG TPA: hypothetical protein [Caudoviricetes sp.]